MSKMDWIFFLTAFVIGLIPAVIASHKGRDFLIWWVFGDLFFFIALPAAILIRAGHPEPDARLLVRSTIRECPFCGGVNHRETDICLYCQRVIRSV